MDLEDWALEKAEEEQYIEDIDTILDSILGGDEVELINSNLFHDLSNRLTRIDDILQVKKGDFTPACGFAGYIRGRSLPENFNITDLPVSDFFRVSEKAKPYDQNGKVSKERFYQKYKNGSLDTLIANSYIQRAVGLAFNMTCAALYDLWFCINNYSKALKVEDDIHEILRVLNKKDKKKANLLYERYTSVRYMCYTMYEDRTLSGYVEAYWPFWGRLLGLGSPSCESDPSLYLSPEKAENARNSITVNRSFSWNTYTRSRNEFLKIFRISKIDTSVKSDNLILLIHRYFTLVSMYNALESGRVNIEDLINPNKLSKKDIDFNIRFAHVAILVGLIRRASRGALVAGDIKDVREVTYISKEEILEHKQALEKLCGIKIMMDESLLSEYFEEAPARRRALCYLFLERINLTYKTKYDITNLLKVYNPKTQELEYNSLGSNIMEMTTEYNRRIQLTRAAYSYSVIARCSTDPSTVYRTLRSRGFTSFI